MQNNLQEKIDAVLALKSLTPDETTNQVIGDLVTAVLSDSREYKKISDDTRVKLRAVCSNAESEMEFFWSNVITNSDDPSVALEDFLYKGNYEELVARELSLLEKSGKKINRKSQVLVIGSGPLPLTAYEIFSQSGALVDQVDSSEIALTKARDFMYAFRQKGDFFCEKGDKVQLEKMYDVVIIAALAGENTRQKQKIIDAILPHLASDGRIVVRSAKGARALLYPAVNIRKIQGLELLDNYHPEDKVINSILLYKRKK